MPINTSICCPIDGEGAGDQAPPHDHSMFNTNQFFLNRVQSKFQGQRRLRFTTNRLSKAERLDSYRGQHSDQDTNRFEAQQTDLQARANGEARLEGDTTQWTKAGIGHPGEGKAWSRSLRSLALERGTVEIKGTNNDDFVKSEKASKSLRQGFDKADRQEQQDAFKSHFFMHSNANRTEAETDAEIATGIGGGIIGDQFDWRNDSTNTITQSAFSRANPQAKQFNWQNNFDRNLNLGGLFGPQRIFDASGDASKKEVFEDGALEISYNNSYLNNLKNNHAPEFNFLGMEFSLPGWVSATVSATKSSTGEVIDLGSTSLNLDNNSFYVNLKDQLEASDNLFDRRSTWNIDVDIDATYTNGLNINLEDFNENITMIDALDVGSGYRGDVTANTFTYNNVTWGDSYDTGRIYRGRGGTDTLVLDGINKSDILEFNGSSVNQLGESEAGGAALGEQAFYGGTVFDVLNLNNGDELYLQGIEKISCEDGDIRVRANMSDSTKDQWNLQAMDVSGAWRFNRGSSDVVLVSLDTGIGDITGNPTDIDDEIDHVINKTAKNDSTSATTRDHGHRAMSVMAAEHDSQGLAGIAPNASLWAYNVYQNGESLYDAIDSAEDDRSCNQRLVFQGGIQGGSWWEDGATRGEMEDIIESGSEHSFYAVAAGNGGPGGGVVLEVNYLDSVSGVAQAESDNDHVASIGALQFTGTEEIDGITNITGYQLASYSNRGDNLTYVAPTDSQSINGSGNIGTFTGTSCANPNASGVAALVWSENTDLEGGEVREILTQSAMDLGTYGRDETYGHGLLNAEAAVRRSHALEENYELASFYANDQFLA